MFKTFVGPVEDESNVVWLRPETAQAIFAQFNNIFATARQTVPFGVAQMGKSFRNEINPRNYTFRSREFEQMELEFFIRPDEAVELICGRSPPWPTIPTCGEPQDDWGWEVWHRYWVQQRLATGTAPSACPRRSLVSTGRPATNSPTTPAPASTSNTPSPSACRSSKASPPAPIST
jgi:hypothetical protein